MKVYLDDVRPTPRGWWLARTFQEAIDFLKTNQVTQISLDHDLGEKKTGYDVLLWIEKQTVNGFNPPEIFIHTSNPAGRHNMSLAVESINKIQSKKPLPLLRVIGDVHGHHDEYQWLIERAQYTLQLGDFGFNYDVLCNVDGNKHKILAGNHDNYSKCTQSNFIHMHSNHWLGDYGTINFVGFDIFFVRGGFSIDKATRTEGQSWWPDEELTYKEMSKAIELFGEIKPNFVITHECPAEVINLIKPHNDFKPSMTSNMLQQMHDIHKPDMWLFGHHHVQWCGTHKNTKFECIPIMGYKDFSA